MQQPVLLQAGGMHVVTPC